MYTLKSGRKINHLEKKLLAFFSFIFIILGCSSDNGELPSYGELRATINGELITFNAGKAKIYPGIQGSLSVYGGNCEEGKKYIRLDVPLMEGNYSYESGTLPGAYYYIDAAFACTNGSGTATSRIVREAEVTVTLLSDSRIRGTFEMVAGNPQIDDIDIIVDGYFDVARE